jgi:isopentenyl diphosphate isomerase/L-lactate dehydrogenase-like FMN-dependent dehydrogenase
VRGEQVTLPATVWDFERAAADVLDDGPLGYLAGGAADEVTMRDNIDAWRRLAIRPRVMVDVSVRDPSVTVLGRPRAHPLMVAPMGFHSVAHPEAEAATVRAAAATGTPFCLSTMSTTSARELELAAPDATRWFQLYVLKDRALTGELVAAAAEHGFEALVMTADLPVFGHRERILRSGFAIDEATAASSVLGRARLTPDEMATALDPSLTWDDVADLADESDLPLLVKGILTAADARRAADSGAAGVVVSNHGGRQLDTVPATADALPEVVEEVGGELDVLVDGGIRRGTDVLKALALGAAATMVGRPVAWGLAVGGQEGVERVLGLMLEELDRALALAGAPVAGELDPGFLQRREAPYR